MVSPFCKFCIYFCSINCPLQDEVTKYYIKACNVYTTAHIDGSVPKKHMFNVIERVNTKRYRHVQIQVEADARHFKFDTLRLISLNDCFVNKRKDVVKTVLRWSLTLNHHPVMVTSDFQHAFKTFENFFFIQYRPMFNKEGNLR